MDQITVLVFFNIKELGGSSRFDRDAKSAILDRGITTLHSRFPAACVARPNASACSVSVTGDHETIAELVAYIESNRDFATYVVDCPAISPASSESVARVVQREVLRTYARAQEATRATPEM